VARKFPLRFSLARLLLILTAAIVLFGYAQARRISMRSEVAALENEGAIVTRLPPGEFESPRGLSDGWVDKLWQRQPTDGELYVKELSPSKFRVGGEYLNRHQLIERLLALEVRVRALGAEGIRVCADGVPPYTPSNWAYELDPLTDARILACKLGDSTYEYIPGMKYDE
jgi:hypothetical protein